MAYLLEPQTFHNIHVFKDTQALLMTSSYVRGSKFENFVKCCVLNVSSQIHVLET